MRFWDMFDGFEDYFSSASSSVRKEFTQEQQEYTKNGIRTVVTAFFDEEGYLVRLQGESSTLPTKEDEEKVKQLKIKQINEKIAEAVQAEDFLKAAELQKQKEAL